MPIISKIGRRSLKTRLLLAAIYTVLSAGAVTMIYPFLLLISGSTKSAVDTPQSMIVPEFLKNEIGLFRKHTEGFFNEVPSLYSAVCRVDKPFFESATPPPSPNAKLFGDWHEFLSHSKLPHYYYTISYISVQTSKSVAPSNLRRFKSEMSQRFAGDIGKFNAGMGTSFPSWTQFRVLEGDLVLRTYKCGDSDWDRAYFKFKESVPIDDRIYFSVPGDFAQIYLKAQYTNDISEYNKSHGTNFASWAEIGITRNVPPETQKAGRADWESFVRDILATQWIRIAPSANPLYREFLKEKYNGDIAELNKKHGSSYGQFDEIRADGEPPMKGVAASDWATFLSGYKDPESGKSFKAPLESLSICCIDFLFQDYLKGKYGEIASANSSLGTSFKSWNDILAPQAETNFLAFKNKKTSLRWEFCTRNFISVIDYLLLHGNALFNTVVYCGLTILCALIVNPIAAYALSRFKLPSTYKVLLFLMMTMAFPPVVTQIPNFLMLRDLSLLNSYAALILPGLANGYSIFLLKGFFDSLPQELYESASMDGAGEMRIFFQITMSLSKPILAVIALGAFTSAYGNFMMALLVCQDRNMWTIMPFLFELQQIGCQGLVFASLLIAAIPTLIIFTFCQNIIMRGIVVPVEK